jgi:hypothetical protein
LLGRWLPARSGISVVPEHLLQLGKRQFSEPISLPVLLQLLLLPFRLLIKYGMYASMRRLLSRPHITDHKIEKQARRRKL